MRLRSLIFNLVLLHNLVVEANPNTCEFDFKVYIYDLPKDLNVVKYAEEARKNGTYHVCAGCIFVSVNVC